jgi:hypothetical protein
MFKKIISVSFFVLAGSLIGCASTTPRDSSKDAYAAAMTCPKCETVWVTRLADQGSKTQRMVSERQMTCPECDVTARGYLKDGNTVLHDCTSCKTTMIPVKPAEATSPKGSRTF